MKLVSASDKVYQYPCRSGELAKGHKPHVYSRPAPQPNLRSTRSTSNLQSFHKYVGGVYESCLISSQKCCSLSLVRWQVQARTCLVQQKWHVYLIVLIQQLTESMQMANVVRACVSITVPGSTGTTKPSPGCYKFEQRHFYFYYPYSRWCPTSYVRRQNERTCFYRWLQGNTSLNCGWVTNKATWLWMRSAFCWGCVSGHWAPPVTQPSLSCCDLATVCLCGLTSIFLHWAGKKTCCSPFSTYFLG